MARAASYRWPPAKKKKSKEHKQMADKYQRHTTHVLSLSREKKFYFMYVSLCVCVCVCV